MAENTFKARLKVQVSFRMRDTMPLCMEQLIEQE